MKSSGQNIPRRIGSSLASRMPTCRRDAAKASWELLSRVRNWLQMLLANLEALRLSMASCATFRFHSSVMAGGLTHVMRWMIYRTGSVSARTGGGQEPPERTDVPPVGASPSYEERSPGKAKTPLQFHRPQNQSSDQRKASKNTRPSLRARNPHQGHLAPGVPDNCLSELSMEKEPRRMPEKKPHKWPLATKPGSEKTFRPGKRNMKKLVKETLMAA